MAIDERIQHFEKACRDAGLKVTHQRLEIFRELVSATDHPSAETLHRRLGRKLPTVSLDTVYRTLHTFEEHGLISRIETTESQARFEAKMSTHHHFICKECGRIIDFDFGGLDEGRITEGVSDLGQVERMTITLHGRCRACSAD